MSRQKLWPMQICGVGMNCRLNRADTWVQGLLWPDVESRVCHVIGLGCYICGESLEDFKLRGGHG